jgi:hypothetical protein
VRGRTRDGHSSGTPVAWRLEQPTRTAGSGHRSRSFGGLRRTSSAPSLFGLAPGGVCRAACVAADAVRSYRTVSPLPLPLSSPPPLAGEVGRGPRRSGLCGTFPRLAPAGHYPAPYVHGARTFLPGDLSVLAGAAVQPTDALGNGRSLPSRQGSGRELVIDVSLYDLWRGLGPNGSMIATPAGLKSDALRVTTVSPCSSAVAAIMRSALSLRRAALKAPQRRAGSRHRPAG